MGTVLDALVPRRCDSEHAQGSAAETYSGDRIAAARLWVNTSLSFILRAAPKASVGEAKTLRLGLSTQRCDFQLFQDTGL